MNFQARAILWAQFRSLLNYFPRSSKGGLVFGIAVSLFWYGIWTVFAASLVFVIAHMSEPAELKILASVLSGGLFLMILYWQIIPVLMASSGASLEIKKLRVYPIPHSQLFMIEVLLRVTTGIEMLLVLAGAALGLLFNPKLPFWCPLILLPFVVMNLTCAAGTREILSRIFARKRVREIAVFLLVCVGALPQLIFATNSHGSIRNWLAYETWFLPWSATASLAAGNWTLRAFIVVLAWTGLAYSFGRYQFERGLNFDADAARSSSLTKHRSGGRFSQMFFSWPSHLFPDPLAALVEKELRFLSRAPRFRLVFTMGFTFGLVIWLPLAMRGPSGSAFMRDNYLTLICVYALLLLGDVCFWNTFGFDRRAAQVYFVMPVRFDTVLLAKNITALFFVLLEITAILVVCSILRMPVTPARLLEAYSVTLVITLYLVSVGNLTSTHNPRAVNPEKSMRSGAAGQMQALLVLVYPVAAIPVGLAYGARYAFDSIAAFYVVLVLAAGIGAIVYWVAKDSAVKTAEENREKLVDRLSQGEGLIQA